MTAWKEQGVTIRGAQPADGAEIVLEGLWQAGGNGGAVIAPPHPQYGGSLDSPVVNELAYGLHKGDVPSLRFNWRGVGASQGAVTGDPAAAEADYLAALDHLAATAEGRIFGCGYSFGAATAVRAALRDPRLNVLVLVAPPVQMLETMPLDELEIPVWVISGGRDDFSPGDRLSELLAPLASSRLQILPGADHFFMSGGLADIAAFARSATAGFGRSSADS